jgi:outer membrane lipoprotein SlyB
MTAPDATGEAPVAGNYGTDLSGASFGALMGEIAADLSALMRQEVELAKAEVRAEVAKAGKAAGMLGGAGFAGYMVLVLGSLAIAYALGDRIGFGWGTFIVTAVWAIAGAILGLTGRKQLKSINPKPELTVESIKEDVQWAQHPTS